MNATEPGPAGRRGVMRWVGAAFLLFAVAVLILLGVWQVQRLGWKLDLIERIEQRVHAEPVTAPTDTGLSAGQLDDIEYSRVRAEGEFRHDLEVQVYALTDLGAGYWVMTPLQRSDAVGVLWVNRGFVDTALRDPATRPDGQVQGPVSVVGLVRVPEVSGFALRPNVPAENRWYTRSVQELSEGRGLVQQPVAPYFVDADATPNPGGWPRGGMTRLQFSNNHLGYALTWFTMALLAVVALVLFVRSEFRRQRPSADGSGREV